jgi:lambda family phage portal protein
MKIVLKPGGIFDRMMRRIGYQRPAMQRRSFEAAAVNRLTMDWGTTPFSADWDIRYSLRQLRARSRELAQNNEYARKFLKMVATNVIGPDGVMLRPTLRDKNNKLDKTNNQAILNSWNEWSQPSNCTVTGLLSWPAFQRQIIETVARDGEVFIRIVRGYPNDFGFALQALEAEYFDVNLNRPGENIRMSIEYDDWRRPIAYWQMASNIYDYQPPMHSIKYIRYPASDILHIYWQERPEQGRGIPWMTSAMTNMWQLKGYKESELVAARAAASKMGFLEPGLQGAEDAYTGDSKDEKGNVITEFEPGAMETLPRGYKFTPFDPQHPTTAFEHFVKSALRGISAGFLVSYNSLANDLEGVNYSSIRQGVIDERDVFRVLQALVIDGLCQPVFENWLPMARIKRKLTIPMDKISINQMRWRPRGWDWVDPLKDQQAQMVAINTGLASRTDILAKEGEDFEELMEEIAHERDVIRQKGLIFDVSANPSPAKMGANPNPLIPGVNEPAQQPIQPGKNKGAEA